MGIRKWVAVQSCKTLSRVCRLAGSRGTNLPGRAASKLCPGLLSALAGEVRGPIVAVCGTDGKTSTANQLYCLLRAGSRTPAANLAGANMLYGVTTALALATGPAGRLASDSAVLEVDELSAPRVFGPLQPDIVILTNLFRDQLDRYGEIDTVLAALKKALLECPHARLILNADDPLSVSLGRWWCEQPEGVSSRPHAPAPASLPRCLYVGIGEDTGGTPLGAREGRFCLFCGAELEYDYYHYSQLGHWHCPSCGAARPDAVLEIRNVDRTDRLRFDLVPEPDVLSEGPVPWLPVREVPIQLPLRALYGAYNFAMAFLAAALVQNSVPDADEALRLYRPQPGRSQVFYIGGTEVTLMLSKNPASFDQVLSTLHGDDRERSLMIAVNDNPPDGQDISWLWDVNFEQLDSYKNRLITVSGLRADDLAVRLKYAGFPMQRACREPDLERAVRRTLAAGAPSCCILANYTAVFKVEKILKKMEREQWKHKKD